MLMNARAELLPHHLPFTVVPAHALKRKLGAAAQNTANHMSSTSTADALLRAETRKAAHASPAISLITDCAITSR